MDIIMHFMYICASECDGKNIEMKRKNHEEQKNGIKMEVRMKRIQKKRKIAKERTNEFNKVDDGW